MLLIGDHEVIYDPARTLARARRVLTTAEALIVPGANHNAECTAPEFVNDQILRFLAS
jgi:pimeloyl-ACP methyl ester carboxylesterase